jgi:hypothetical protein
MSISKTSLVGAEDRGKDLSAFISDKNKQQKSKKNNDSITLTTTGMTSRTTLDASMNDISGNTIPLHMDDSSRRDDHGVWGYRRKIQAMTADNATCKSGNHHAPCSSRLSFAKASSPSSSSGLSWSHTLSMLPRSRSKKRMLRNAKLLSHQYCARSGNSRSDDRLLLLQHQTPSLSSKGSTAEPWNPHNLPCF